VPNTRLVGIAGVVSVASLGAAPALYAWGVRKRRRQYDALFRYGRFTPGIIRAVHKIEGGVYATFKYEFSAGETSYLAQMEQAREMARSWSEGDHVAVLYDPEDPSRCCFVYR
jgi:hypothetical protein